MVQCVCISANNVGTPDIGTDIVGGQDNVKITTNIVSDRDKSRNYIRYHRRGR